MNRQTEIFSNKIELQSGLFVLIVIKTMFLFSCCTSHESDYQYEIRQDYRKTKTSDSPSELLQSINSSKQYVIKVKKSKLQNIIKTNPKEKARDIEFPPQKQSLGNIPAVQTCSWKRLSQMVPHPILFTTSKSRVNKTSEFSLTGDYFLSALSAIAQQPKRIRDMFVTQDISQNGVYVIKLRVNGEIQEIAIDDYVPVNDLGQPLFSAPKESEIWIPLIEKAWAKVNKSYENILNGTSAQVFKALNFAPSQVFYLEDKQQKKQKLWKLLTQESHQKSPVSCLTSHDEAIDWIHLNLIPNCHYTLLYAAEVYHKDKKSFRVVKLRNPNSQANWQGKGSIHDRQFWSDALASHQKITFLQNFDQKSGDLLMLYTDFVKFFSEINISYQLPQGNFIWQEIFFNSKNGSFWQVEITHDGEYSFQLHQQSQRNKDIQEQEHSYGRSTIILGRVNQNKSYEYVSGTMRFSEEDTLVNTFLSQGKYIIYAKIQYKDKLPSLDHKSSLSCYSNKLCRFKVIEKKNCPNFLQSMFLNYARINKRQQYNRDKMWLSWKLLFKECGFAYIAFGNAKDSDKKFSVKFESKDFESMHFKLKSPFKATKGKENTVYEISVLPGEQKIILARVFNTKVMTLKFPPPIEMKIEELGS